jgi:Concanavalin A-like lectin/glucanases superfamily/Right handed beta helix region
MKRILFSILLLLCTGAVHATNYYASPGGSGGCSTDRNSPSSFNTGVGCIGSGDSLRLRAGTYNIGPWGGPPSGSSSTNRVTVEGDPGDGNRPAQLNVGPSGGNGISLGVKNFITFKNLKILGNNVDASVMKWDDPSQGIRVENCEVWHEPQIETNGQQGIHPHGDGHVLIGNTIHNNGVNQREHAIYCNCTNGIIDGNELYGNGGFGVHNYADNAEANRGTIVRNNIVHDNLVGILLSNGSDQQAYNNLLYNHTSWSFQTYSGDNVFVANNTIVNGSAEAMNCGSSGVYVNNIALGTGNNSISCPGTSSPNLTSGSMTAVFENPGANIFRLKAGSPAIDVGTSGSGVSSRVTKDLDGNDRPVDGDNAGGAQWDMGAYEFGGSSPVCPPTCTCTVPGVCDAAANSFYVATGGLDTNAGTSDAPFQHIQKCASVATSGQTCIIRAGTYRETVTPTSNGVTFQPEGNAVVTVSGADVITGWTVHSGNIYRSNGMTWNLTVNFNQVFVDGVAQNLARSPNASLDLSHPNWYVADSSIPTEDISTSTFEIFDSELTQPSGFWNGAEVTHMAAGMYSMAGTVTSYTTGHIVASNPHGDQSRFMESPMGQQYKYYLSNKLEALDTGGEWYFDGTVLYLWPLTNDSPAAHVVEAKRRQFGFDLSNRSNITIKNLKLFAASINMNPSSSNNVIDGLDAKYVWHQLRNVPAAGIGQTDPKWGSWNTGIILAGTDNILKNCTIAWSSNNGVYLRNTRQTVENCTIHDIQYLASEGGAVSWMGDTTTGGSTVGHVVRQNTLYNSGRHLVNHYYAQNILITNNLMYNFCLTGGDCGATYTVKPEGSGTISFNIVHDTFSPYFNFGIYMDDDSQNMLVHHNVVWTNTGGCGIVHKSSNFQIYNNTVNDSGTAICTQGGGTNVIIANNLGDNGIPSGNNNLQTTNAMYVNEGGHDYQLTANSPAVNQGQFISGITTNCMGNCDIGAYEFGAPAWTAGVTTPAVCPCGTTGCPLCPTGGPIATWTFDAGTGTTAVDSVGNNHATLSGGATWGPPRVGAFSIALDGVGAYLNLPTTVITNFSSDHTVCMWAKTTNPAALGSGTFKQTLLDLSPDGSTGLRWVIIEAPAPGGKWNVTHSLNGTPTWLTTSAQVFTANTWVYLCHTYVGATNTLALYVNGLPATATPPAGDFYFPTTNAIFGSRSSIDGMVSGGIDKTDIWDRALSSAEIAALVTTRKSITHRRIPSR